MANLMPSIFFGHGNPMNALSKNSFTDGWLRQSLDFLDVPAMQQPEAYIGGAAQLFDAKGKITTDATRDFLVKYLDAFAAWVARNSAK